MIIACDVDDTVADLLPAWLERYNKDYDDHLVPADIKSWAVSDYVRPMCGVKVYDYLTADLYDEVQTVPGAYEGIRRLKTQGHRVVFVTSTPKGIHGVRLQWLLKYGFLDSTLDMRLLDDYVECHDKGLILADVMIDDRPHNLERFTGRHKILFSQPHNETYPHDANGMFRAKDWLAVMQQVQKINLIEWSMANNPTEVMQPVLHITEERCPNQTRRFREIIDQMYQVHLDKNADYSPANIMGVGELGLATRLWDKVTRYMNLMGFNIRAELIEYTGPKTAKNESIEDTLMDLSVYGIIGRLMREGKWGK